MLETLSLLTPRGSWWGQSHSGPLGVPLPTFPGLPSSAGYPLPWLVKNVTQLPFALEAIALALHLHPSKSLRPPKAPAQEDRAQVLDRDIAGSEEFVSMCFNAPRKEQHPMLEP